MENGHVSSRGSQQYSGEAGAAAYGRPEGHRDADALSVPCGKLTWAVVKTLVV